MQIMLSYNYDFKKVSFLAPFLIDIYTNDLSKENDDNEQSNLFKKLGNLNKGRKSYEKISFLKNVKTLLKARQDVLNHFKSNLFPIKNSMSDAAPYATTRHTKSEKCKLIENFIDEIRNDEKSTKP